MATSACDYSLLQTSSQRRGMAMVLAMVTAVVLSPLYAGGGQKDGHSHSLWNSGFVLPMLLTGLIVAIKTTSSSSSSKESSSSSSSSSWVLQIGGGSWRVAAILGLLLFVVYWQDSVQHFFWR